jgi:hypothetical protein
MPILGWTVRGRGVPFLAWKGSTVYRHRTFDGEGGGRPILLQRCTTSCFRLQPSGFLIGSTGQLYFSADPCCPLLMSSRAAPTRFLIQTVNKHEGFADSTSALTTGTFEFKKALLNLTVSLGPLSQSAQLSNSSQDTCHRVKAQSRPEFFLPRTLRNGGCDCLQGGSLFRSRLW